MKLEEALLCIDCEAVYSLSSQCPECASQVSYPLSRALNRPPGASASSAGLPVMRPEPPARAWSGPRRTGDVLNLLQTA